MQYINNKSDFALDVALTAMLPDGTVVATAPPQCDFVLVFGTRYSEAKYEVGRYNGEARGYTVNADGSIHVVFDAHGLGLGRLGCSLTFGIPDSSYPDGVATITTSYELEVELIGWGADGHQSGAVTLATEAAAVSAAQQAQAAAAQAAGQVTSAVDTAKEAKTIAQQAEAKAEAAVAALGDEVHNVGLQCDAIEADTTAGFDAINKALAGGTIGGGGGGQKVTAAGELKYVRNTMPYNAQPGYRYRYDKGIRLPLGDAGTVIDMSKLFAKINPAPESINFSCRVQGHSPQVTYDAEAQTITYNEDITNVDNANYQVYVYFVEKSEGKGGNKLFMAVDADGALYICGQYQDSREVLAPPSVGEVLIEIEHGKPDGARYIQLQKRVQTVRLRDGRLKKWWADYNVNCHVQHIGVFRARFKGRKYTSRWIYVTYHTQMGIKPI